MIEHCLFCESCWVEFSLPQPRFCSHCGALHNSKNIQRNNEKLESSNLLSMPTFKNPKQKTPKGTEATMKMALWKLKAIAPHQ
ncbi:unnamed protein product [Sphagnum troendelagicum]|uniref:C2H2-type domain-containing protein n=1 Tax=Sphagnum troendelagicum TaxID=128251 RepID=A0ABP0US28_9BRYO